MNLPTMQPLTPDAAHRLNECEATIERGLTTFVEVGQALMEIRDQRLYRESHGRFEDYCQQRWGMVRRHANRLIEAAEVTVGLGPIGPIPSAESVARELPREPEQAREVWTESVERHGEKPTAAQVREVRHELVEVEVIDPDDDELTAKRQARLRRQHERQEIIDAAVSLIADTARYLDRHKIRPNELVTQTRRLPDLSRCSPDLLAYMRSVEAEINTARPDMTPQSPGGRPTHTEDTA